MDGAQMREDITAKRAWDRVKFVCTTSLLARKLRAGVLAKFHADSRQSSTVPG